MEVRSQIFPFNEFLKKKAERMVEGSVRNELLRHKDIETDGDKIINIWGIFGSQKENFLEDDSNEQIGGIEGPLNEALLARILGLTRQEMLDAIKYGFVGEDKKKRLNMTFAYASILEREVKNENGEPDPQRISKVITAPSSFLCKDFDTNNPKRSPMDCMMEGDVERVLFLTVSGFRALNSKTGKKFAENWDRRGRI